MAPRVFTADAVLARAAGTDVHLLTVEVWDTGVVVRLIGAVNDRVRADLDAYGKLMAQRRPGAGQRLPKAPGERIFDQVRVSLTDDLGTAYRCTSGSAGGSGTEMLCQWNFQPALPPSAATLTVTGKSKNGTENSCVFRLV